MKREWMDWATTMAGILVPLLLFLTARIEYQNRRLRKRARLLLIDCIALWYCENAACEEVVHLMPTSGDPRMPRPSALSVKRTIRAKLRARKIETPSDLASPNQLEKELRKL